MQSIRVTGNYGFEFLQDWKALIILQNGVQQLAHLHGPSPFPTSCRLGQHQPSAHLSIKHREIPFQHSKALGQSSKDWLEPPLTQYNHSQPYLCGGQEQDAWMSHLVLLLTQQEILASEISQVYKLVPVSTRLSPCITMWLVPKIKPIDPSINPKFSRELRLRNPSYAQLCSLGRG